MSKKFKGNRALPFIEQRLALSKDITDNYWDQSNWDNGGDWVAFGFEFDAIRYDVVFNGFNGHFVVRTPSGDTVTHESDELDGTPWYDFLLNLVYEPLEEKATA